MFEYQADAITRARFNFESEIFNSNWDGGLSEDESWEELYAELSD